MSNKDPYRILGASRTATQEELKRAYRKLARDYHPDRNAGDKEAERKFKEVQAAWEVLGDPERRRQYDQFGAGGPTPDYAHWGPGGAGMHVNVEDMGGFARRFDLSDIIEQFFGGRRTRPGGPRAARGAGARGAAAPRGGNLEHHVHLSLEEALHGAARDVRVQGPDGSSERITFRVPPGVSDGQRIRLAGRGHPGPGGRGDLLVTCHLLPHPRLRRDGDALHTDATVSFRDAALGAKVDVETLDGVLHLTVPPGTQGGARLRVRGHGLPTRDGRGDLFVTIRLAVPRELSPRARELIEELDGELQPRSTEPSR